MNKSKRFVQINLVLVVYLTLQKNSILFRQSGGIVFFNKSVGFVVFKKFHFLDNIIVVCLLFNY